MTGIRDKLIHQYFGVDLEVIWRTVHKDLPPLLAPLQAVQVELDRTEAERRKWNSRSRRQELGPAKVA